MPEKHIDTLEYFVCPQAEPGGDGTLHQPFASLDEAFRFIAEAGHVLGDLESGQWPHRLEIACVQRAQAPFKPGKRPTFHFYVDAYATDDGDGTELSPWLSLGDGIQVLQRQLESGQLALRPGERLAISYHSVFAPTQLERRKKLMEKIAGSVFLCMAWILVLPVLLIFGYLLVKAWPSMSLDFFFTNPENRMTAGGVWAPLIGTFFLVLISLLIAAPIGVLAGVYLNEYARDNWMTRIINLAVVNLAGVPSIVHALFGVGAFVIGMKFSVPWFGDQGGMSWVEFSTGIGRSLLAASLTVAVMTLPVIITSAREALAAVPMSFREACWNMGATRWQTIRTIVLPNSIAGILTGVILQVARAAGETAPILFTGAVFFVPIEQSGLGAWMPYALDDRFMALSMHLFTLTTQVNGVAEDIQYGTAVVLIGLVLAVNSISIAARIYLRSRNKW